MSKMKKKSKMNKNTKRWATPLTFLLLFAVVVIGFGSVHGKPTETCEIETNLKQPDSVEPILPKKKRKLRLKKSIRRWTSSIPFLLFFAIIIFGFGSVYAWLTDSANATNYMNTPSLSINVAESMNGTDYTGWTPSNINWTSPVPKFTKFTNTGESAIVIRVSYAQHWYLNNAGVITYLSNLAKSGTEFSAVATPHWTMDGLMSSSDWMDNGDGWYYYRKVLMPGQSTDVILDSVVFMNPKPDGYDQAFYELIFNVEACQYSTNPDNANQAASWETFRMTYTEDAGALTWSNTAP